MGPLVTLLLICYMTASARCGIIFPDIDDEIGFNHQNRDKKSINGGVSISPCPGGELFCEDDVDDYPENVEIEDQVIAAKLVKNAIFENEGNKNLEAGDFLRNRNAFVKETRACDNRKATVYPKKAQNVDGKYVFIVNDNNYRQAVDIEQCLGEGEPCLTESDNPTFDSETLCRQKYTTYRMYVINEEGEQVYDSFSLPSACLCHHKSNFAIRNAFKSVPDTPPLPTCSGPEKLALNKEPSKKLEAKEKPKRKPSSSGIRFEGRRRREVESLNPVNDCVGNYCEEENEKYPTEIVLKALEANEDLNPDLFGQLFDTQCTPAGIKTRFFNIDEEQLCYGVPKIIFPRQAKNLKDEWKYIVNIENYTQSVEVEECFNYNTNSSDDDDDDSVKAGDGEVQFDNVEVVEEFGSCLYSGAPGNNPGLTSCRQLFTEHKLLSLSADGQLVVDSFKLPSACACFFKEDFILEFRRDEMSDKTETPELNLPDQVDESISLPGDDDQQEETLRFE